MDSRYANCIRIKKAMECGKLWCLSCVTGICKLIRDIYSVNTMFHSSSKTEPFMQRSRLQDDPFLRPGLGLPLDYSPMEQNVYGVLNKSLFPNANDDRDIKEGNVE